MEGSDDRPAKKPISERQVPQGQIPQEQDQTDNFRLGLFRAIKNGRVSIEKCDLDFLFDDIKILDKTSASNSVIFFAVINRDLLDQDEKNRNYNKRVTVKISLEDATDLDNSLSMERAIYRDVVSRLLALHYTPNLVAYIGSLDCKGRIVPRDDEEGSASYNVQKMVNDLEKKVTRGNKKRYTKDNIQVLLLEYVDGIPLVDWYLNTARTDDDYRSILFQLLYTVSVFSAVGLQHNDLHLGNILLQKLREPRIFVYFISEEEYYVVTVKWLLKIFDWDFGFFGQVINTKLIPICQSTGICNDKNSKFDAFTTLCLLNRGAAKFKDVASRRDEYTFLTETIKSFFPDQRILTAPFKKTCRLCQLRKELTTGEIFCKGPWEPADSQMLNPKEMIRTDVFKSMRGVLPIYDKDYDPTFYEDVYFFPGLKRDNILSVTSSRKVVDVTFEETL